MSEQEQKEFLYLHGEGWTIKTMPYGYLLELKRGGTIVTVPFDEKQALIIAKLFRPPPPLDTAAIL